MKHADPFTNQYSVRPAQSKRAAWLQGTDTTETIRIDPVAPRKSNHFLKLGFAPVNTLRGPQHHLLLRSMR
ncbi:hypothetical protein DSO57_1015960 [Entomophthora muscae]|uniref:Uncharacterized protein n=1 Tax=Entomophthora muscae TaxID=34485 RepID=A0ACC2T565_9FUNG|nr:hypothetical protein DSO57_1015960 [Entomophthora muscae]